MPVCPSSITVSCCTAESSQHSRQEDDIESTMDQIFGGILRSDVVCGTCGYTSTAHDPFKDISVDIPEPLKHVPTPPHVDTPKPNPVKRNSRTNARGSNGKWLCACRSHLASIHCMLPSCLLHAQHQSLPQTRPPTPLIPTEVQLYQMTGQRVKPGQQAKHVTDVVTDGYSRSPFKGCVKLPSTVSHVLQ